ncbi:MAG: exodeoxyribonuclease VII small subunit [Candidatus Limnocylindria bacterium]
MVAELQRVVGTLEVGNLPLEDTIELYRYALKLHAQCEERLRTAELKITELGRREGQETTA